MPPRGAPQHDHPSLHRPLPLWELLIHLSGGRCQCTGQCGSKHAAGQGSCEHENGGFISKHAGPIRLLAAPSDAHELTRPAHQQSRLSACDLAAWCPPCHDKARNKALREHRTQLTAQIVAVTDARSEPHSDSAGPVHGLWTGPAAPHRRADS